MNKTHQSIYDSIITSGYEDKSLTYIFETAGGFKREYCVADLFDRIEGTEIEALSCIAKGDRLLDAGAGGGRISSYLQARAFYVTALEKSRAACGILKKRGLKNVVNDDIFRYIPVRKYDAVLFFHAWSILGKDKDSISTIFHLLEKRLLNKNGRVFFAFKDCLLREGNPLKRRFVFKKQKGPWFKTHFFDSDKIITAGKKHGWFVQRFRIDALRQYSLIMARQAK